MTKYEELEELKSKYENENKKIEHNLTIYSVLRLVTAILCIVMFFIAIFKYKFFYIFSALFLILFIIFIILHKRLYKKYDRTLFKIAAISDYTRRRGEEWKHLCDKGEDFLDKENYLINDLSIFGESSIYQYITLAKTGYGRKKLADTLVNGANDIKEYSQSSSELTLDLEKRLSLEASLRYYSKNNTSTKYKDMKNALGLINSKINLPRYLLILSSFVILINVLVITLACLKIINFVFIAIPPVIFYFILFRINGLAELRSNMAAIGDIFSGYDEIINVYTSYEYKSSNLINIKDNLLSIKSSSIKKFNILNNFISSSNNIIYSLIFNGFFAVDIWMSFLYKSWAKKHSAKMEEMVLDVAEVETLLSLSVIGIAKDKAVYGKIDTKFEMKEVYHPLICQNKAVANDFTLKGLNIITGSNMSGKTTFMRTIGLNYILFKAGSMVCASSFNAADYTLFTSMKVEDDIANGISTFYGEIKRIKQIIDFIPSNKPMLVLIDEIFKGTNTIDRLTGAKEVCMHLMADNILGIITTHDFELCNIKGVFNYHFQEYYQNDQIKFDYKIKNGVSQTRNAIYLLKMAGIIKEGE